MEKFTNWRDAATGISPFMPVPQPKSSALLTPLKLTAFVLRLALVALLSVLYIVSLPVPPIQRLVLGLILEFAFGVVETEVQVDGVKRSNTKVIDANRPKKQDLLVANLSSPLDPLVLAYSADSSACVFLIPDRQGQLRQYSAWGAFLFCLRDPATAHVGKVVSDLAKLKSQTVFVFPEGTTSNNKAILPFSVSIDKSVYNGVFKLKAVSIKSQPAHLITTPLPLSLASFVWRNMSHLKLETRFKLKIFLLDADSTEKEIRESLSNYGKLNLVGKKLTVDEKLQFLAAFKKGKRQ